MFVPSNLHYYPFWTSLAWEIINVDVFSPLYLDLCNYGAKPNPN
jgi:hypothetical protein